MFERSWCWSPVSLISYTRKHFFRMISRNGDNQTNNFSQQSSNSIELNQQDLDEIEPMEMNQTYSHRVHLLVE